MTDLIDRLKKAKKRYGAMAELSRMSGLNPATLSRLANGMSSGTRWESGLKLQRALDAYEAGELARLREIESRIPVTMEVRAGKNSSEGLAAV